MHDVIIKVNKLFNEAIDNHAFKLTPTQLVAAWRRGELSVQELLDRLPADSPIRLRVEMITKRGR